MIRRLFANLLHTARSDSFGDRVHFHPGDSGRPYACHDARCDPAERHPGRVHLLV